MFAFKDKTSLASPVHKKQAAKNNTGIPNQLKNRIEHLSGYSMDDVKIHYNSAKPAQVRALAYTQKNDVYLGAGQEQHLGHELWHVVQQKQGRVMPTTQVNGFQVNDNAALEHEADLYGKKAAQLKAVIPQNVLTGSPAPNSNTLQRFEKKGITYNTVGEYYQELQNANKTTKRYARKTDLDKLIDIFSQNFIFQIDISNCVNWSQITTAIKTKLSENPENMLNMFKLYKENMYPGMDLTTAHTRQSIFLDKCDVIERYIKNMDLFKLMYYHENLDRNPEPADPGTPMEQIDPNDISDDFVADRSCVITALFYAETERIKNEFHAESVEQFHKVLVGAFKHNQYTDKPDATAHQKNNVWKNYSDDSVYPSLYAYFGYTPHDECHDMLLRTAINARNLPTKKGMICVEGHMLYFDNTSGQPTFFDNDNHDAAPSNAVKNKRIKCIYYKD